MAGQILIAGIGNIFMGDDAFGCEVARELSHRTWPEEVTIVDFGIRGLDLAYALLEDYATTIFIDATPQGGTPGSIYTMELNIADAGEASAFVDAHSMHPLNVLRMVQTLGGTSARILLVGCEPEDLGDELEGKMGLSETVQAAIPVAIQQVENLVSSLISEANNNPTKQLKDASIPVEHPSVNSQ